MDQQPNNQQSKQLPVDPELAGHLEELAAMAAEVGAYGTLFIRSPLLARLFVDFGLSPEAVPLAGFDTPPAGVILISIFAASDGGEPGVHVAEINKLETDEPATEGGGGKIEASK